ncbi:MAG: cell division protein ZapA [Oscillospiraceae bacterium]
MNNRKLGIFKPSEVLRRRLAMESNKYEVKINGVEYTLVSNETEEYAQRVALLVNKKINQIMEVNPQLSTAMAAVLTSLNLADEYLKNESVLDNLRVEINKYTEESRERGIELEDKKLEVEKLKEDMHKLQIDIARKETEIANYKRR